MEKSLDRSELVAIRGGRESDLPFIYSTWLKNLRYGNSWFEAIDQEVYYDVYHNVIEQVLASPGVTVKVACLRDDPEVILGYSVFKGPRLDYVFVKSAWRGIGIAKLLVPTNIAVVSHLTKVGLALLRKRPNIKFNPFNLG